MEQNSISLPQNKMATVPIGKLLFSMSLPLMLSMIMEALYNVVDSLFISRVSEKALTALSLSFPIQLLVVSISVGTGVGINSTLSRFLGQKNSKGVNDIATNGIFLESLTYILFLIFGLFFTKKFFASQTSNIEIYELGVDYLSICMIFSFGSVGQITFQKFLQSTGKTTLSMVSQLVGAIFNIIFDPLLIFGLCGFPKMGVKGAAIATVIGQIIAMFIAIYFNFSKNKEIHFNFKKFRPAKDMIYEIYKVGIPAIVMQSLNSLMAFGVNYILIKLSATAVTAFGIYIKVQNFIFMPAFGINNAVIAITAYNYGARKKERINSTLKFGILYASVIMILGMLMMQLFPRQILDLFDASQDLSNMGVIVMRTISLSFIFTALTLVWQGFYQALGNGIYSLVVTLLRVVVILLPVLYIFSVILPIDKIWIAFILAEFGSAIVAAFLLRHIYKEKIAILEDQEVA